MAIAVRCACGASYNLRDEYAGTQVKCTACGAALDVPADTASHDPLFTLPRLLIKQKKLSLNECYYIRDEKEALLAFAVRPVHLLRNLLAFAGCGGTAILGVVLLGATLALVGDNAGLQAVATMFFTPAIVIGSIATAIFLSPKRHLTIYRDEAKSQPILEVLQDRKVQFIEATYTVRAAGGEVIGLLRKNYLYNILRKRWVLLSPDGRLIAMAKEDSILLSLLRRLIGPLLGILRINFIIVRGDSDEVIGEFNRKFTLFDCYVLDLSADRTGVLDRRLALGLGVMLDTWERR